MWRRDHAVRRSVGDAVVGLGERAFGVGHPVELEVVVAGDEVIDLAQHVGERGRTFVRVQDEAVDAPQRHLGDDADGAHADQGGREQVGPLRRRTPDDLARPGDQFDLLDECGQAAVRRAGAVGTGRQCSRDGLYVDVGEVGEREAMRGERRLSAAIVVPARTRASPDAESTATRPDRPDMSNRMPVVTAGGRERVAAADRLQLLAVCGGRANRVGHLVRSRGSDDGRRRPLVAGPVTPPDTRLGLPSHRT